MTSFSNCKTSPANRLSRIPDHRIEYLTIYGILVPHHRIF